MSDPQELSVSDLAVLLVNASNNDIDEFNRVYDQLDTATDQLGTLSASNRMLLAQLDESRKENEELLTIYRQLEQGANMVTANAEKHMQLTANANSSRDQAIDKLSTATTQLALYKALGTPKQIRDKFKAYQNKAAIHQTAVTVHKVGVKEYRKQIEQLVESVEEFRITEAVNNMTTVWSDSGNHLLLFPAPLTLRIRGTVEQQLALLFMDNSGCGKLIGIDDEGEPMLCNMPKGGLKPRAGTLRVAGEMLRKYKRQGWKLTKEDLDLGSKR